MITLQSKSAGKPLMGKLIDALLTIIRVMFIHMRRGFQIIMFLNIDDYVYL
jgi:hypothetical protein